MAELDAARRTYLEWCVKLHADLDAELEDIRAAFKEIIGKRARNSKKAGGGFNGPSESADTKASVPPSAKAQS